MKKSRSMKIMGMLSMILFSLVMGVMFSFVLAVSPLVTCGLTFGGYAVMSFAPIQAGILGVGGLQVEIWQAEIINNLFKNNAFLQYSNNEDQYVLNGSVVHIPQATAPSGAQKNRTQLPASVKRRNDIDVTYVLDEYTTDPDFIPNADTVELSYDKMQSVLDEKLSYLKELLAEWVLYSWRPEGADNIIRTTGASIAAHLPGATGNRKKLLIADLKAART